MPATKAIHCIALPATLSKKFLFADDLGLATQVKTFDQGEQNLEQDLNTMGEYYRQWCLCLNDEKTEVTMFHLDNRSASKQLNVFLNGSRLTHNPCPTYLGVPLDRTLTFKQALEQRAEKLKMRNNLLQKLAGAHWGANGNVLRTAALSLVYLAAEYASPVWYRSCHIDKIDVQLNVAMRIVTGTVNSTPLPWLHTLSNIEPPHIRRNLAAHNEWMKITDETRPYDLPIKTEVLHPPPSRLVSRSPIWSDHEIQRADFNANEEWKSFWNNSPKLSNKNLVENPYERLGGFDFGRREWKMLNRFRSGHGCSADWMFKWKFKDSPYCDCEPNTIQTMEHVLQFCPLRKFDGDLSALTNATAESLIWLRDLDIDI